jgi:DNA-binding NtrC family response regulator
MNFTKTSETKACTSPGNIRELQNVIERSLIVCETENFSVDESRLSQQSVKKGAGSRLYLPKKVCFLVSSLGQTSFFSFRRLNWVPKDFGAIERLRRLYFLDHRGPKATGGRANMCFRRHSPQEEQSPTPVRSRSHTSSVG